MSIHPFPVLTDSMVFNARKVKKLASRYSRDPPNRDGKTSYQEWMPWATTLCRIGDGTSSLCSIDVTMNEFNFVKSVPDLLYRWRMLFLIISPLFTCIRHFSICFPSRLRPMIPDWIWSDVLEGLVLQSLQNAKFDI